METSQASQVYSLVGLHAPVQPGPARQCVVVNRNGKRMVLPRYSEADAINQIAIAMVGRTASSEDRRVAWEVLRDQQGYAIRWLQPGSSRSHDRRPLRRGSTLLRGAKPPRNLVAAAANFRFGIPRLID